MLICLRSSAARRIGSRPTVENSIVASDSEAPTENGGGSTVDAESSATVEGAADSGSGGFDNRG